MLYNQTFQLVEVTKLLERVPVDTMIFQNALGHDYLSEAKNVNVSVTELPSDFPPGFPSVAYVNIVSYGNFNVLGYSIYQTYASGQVKRQTTVEVKINGSVITLPNSSVNINSPDGYIMASIAVNAGDTIEITYNAMVESSATGQLDVPAQATISAIYVLSNIEPSTPYTIATVIERILDAGLGNRNGYYTLDPDLYDMLNAIPAPEFCITRKNLYEALLEIGGYGNVQGLPTLKQDSSGDFTIVSYDLLTNTTEWTPSAQVDLDGYIDYSSTQDAESYCGGIEIYADNLVDNSTGGSVEQPFPQTVRTESADLVINDNAAIIPTEFPIWSVQSVIQAFVADGQNVGDITPYIFEKSQYDNLTSYTGDFPTAKQYAFYYVQGQPNLYGLTLKRETATNIDAAVADFAAVAIAARKGKDYNSSNGIACLAYQVHYTPITTRRLRQYKPDLTDGFPTSNVLFYNPTTNIADCKNLGDHAAAQLQKIGNPVRVLTYKIYRVADLPRKGMTVGDEIITQVDYAFEITHIKVTIYVTKYNRLSEYIGINSTKRFYEVSEKQSVQRALNYSFAAVIGNSSPAYRSSNVTINGYTVEKIAATFQRDIVTPVFSKIQCVVATAYDKNGNQIQSPTLHSVSANGFGKSSALYFSFADNYSAGNQAVYCPYTSGGAAQKLQRAVPYADEIGRFYRLEMEYYTREQAIAVSSRLTYFDQVSTKNKASFCDQLPTIDPTIFSDLSSDLNSPVLSLTKVVDKNGGEQISVDTQIHFATNTAGYIIGNALGSRNALVAGYTSSDDVYTPVFVCLPYKLKYNQETIPLSDITAYKVDSPTITPFYNESLITRLVLAYVKIAGVTNTTGTAAQSWAVVHEEDGSILIGQNVDIATGSTANSTFIDLNLRAI